VLKKAFLLLTFVCSSCLLSGAEPERSVVQITTFSQQPACDGPWRFDSVRRSGGSGFVVRGKKIMTNAHVVSWARQILIRRYQDPRPYVARVLFVGHDCDLALLEVENEEFFEGLEPLELGPMPKVRSTVVTYGYPAGGEQISYTRGVVSRIEMQTYAHIGNRAFLAVQTDAAINPGNSGGALVNMSGEVIGINTAIATTNARYQGYGFAVPVNLLKTVAADIIKYGEVRRGYIGVQIALVDQTMANALGMKEAKGVLVQELVAEGAAGAAGLKEGDVILSVDGKEVNKQGELQSYIATRHPGDEVTLKVFREGKTFDKKVVLRPRKEDQTLARNVEGKGTGRDPVVEPARTVAFDGLGFGVRALTAAEKQELRIDKGVLVTDLKPYSEAFKQGIGNNDVILEADRKDVNTPAELKSIITSRKAGDAVLLLIKREGNAGTAFVAVQIPK